MATPATGEEVYTQRGSVTGTGKVSAGQGAIDQVDKRVKEWAASIHPDIAVSLAPPNAPRSGNGIGFYLFEMLPTPPPGSARRNPLEISLRYLVTAWSDTPEGAHQILAELAFAAIANPEFEVDPEGISIAAWSAFSTPPQPSFVLRVPLRRSRLAVSAKLVRQQVQIDSSPMVRLYGVVLGPGDIPLAEARIEIPSLHLSATADYKGRFFFPGVPGEGTKLLRVRVKGRELLVPCKENFPDIEAPLVIHFNALEE